MTKNNYLIGPNGAGKSNIFRGIRLLQAIFNEDKIPDTNDYFDKDDAKKLIVSITIALEESERDAIIKNAIPENYHEIDLLNTSILKEVKYKVAFSKRKKIDEVFSLCDDSNDYMIIEKISDDKYQLHEHNLATYLLRFIRQNNTIVTSTSGGGSIRQPLQTFNSELSRQLSEFFTSIQHIPNMRQSKNMVDAAKAEKTAPNGSNLLNELSTLHDRSRNEYAHYEKETKNVGSAITSIHQPMERSVRVLEIEEDGLKNRVGHPDLSSGYHQMLILVNAIMNINAGVILLEEPELHLHADAQRKILMLIKESGKAQFFIETHSPAFVGANDLESTFLISKHKGASHVTPINNDTTRAIKYELGLRHSNVLDHDCLCMVEGDSEYIAFPIFARRLGYDMGFDLHLLNLHGYGNVKNIKALLAYLKGSDRKIFLLLDENSDASNHTSELIREELIDSNFIYTLEKSFEDQFSSGQLIKAMCNLSEEMIFKFQLTVEDLEAGRKNRCVANIFDEHLNQLNNMSVSYKKKLAEKLATDADRNDLEENGFARQVKKVMMECGKSQIKIDR